MECCYFSLSTTSRNKKCRTRALDDARDGAVDPQGEPVGAAETERGWLSLGLTR